MVLRLGNGCTEKNYSTQLPSNVRLCDHCWASKRPAYVPPGMVW